MNTSPFRIYRSEDREGDYLGKVTTFLDDRPGSLARLANIFGKYGLSIVHFAYNRSEHPNRVNVEVTGDNVEALKAVRNEMASDDLLKSKLHQTMELGVIDTGNILKIHIYLEHRPGQLGKFASLLKDHAANVIYFTYDADISETSADISLATTDFQEIDRLLKDMNSRGYTYSILYKGAGQREIDDVIGLNLIERFFFRLRKVLETGDIERLKRLVESSRLLTETLVRFSQEAGKYYEEGEVLTNILAFAAASLSTTGASFSYRRLPSIPFGAVTFHAFRMPTGANIYLLQDGQELVMIDGSYGHYYQDVKSMLRESGLDPGSITRIYLTHADADHAGMSGYFAEEFGSKVYLHRRARAVLEHQNRLSETHSPIEELNAYFTILVNTLTNFKAPDSWNPYGHSVLEHLGGFNVVDVFDVDGQSFRVLECTEGHVPGQVFIAGLDSGLVFTADYLLLTESLTTEDRKVLTLPKLMLTSTNADSVLFRHEMQKLRELVLAFDRKLGKNGRGVTVIPGHGDYYPAGLLR